jgi:hypothetical protein
MRYTYRATTNERREDVGMSAAPHNDFASKAMFQTIAAIRMT